MIDNRLNKIIELAKHRGFVFQSGEIYGGTRSAWDYGPIGVELKENIRRQWWKDTVQMRDDVYGIDSSIILPREVWVASGHVGVFNDPLTECKQCHSRYRADELIEEYNVRKQRNEVDLTHIPCPNCGNREQWTEPKDFNMMMKTYLGPIEDESGLHYLRPETAQGIFVNFLNVLNSARTKLPFGIAQIGKAFRNEITPGNFIFRTREFEQMEIEYFVKPGDDEVVHQEWIETRLNWYKNLGIKADNLRIFEHPADKLSHYSKRTVDIEYRFGFSGNEWGELEGIANRTDYDLATHMEHSGKDLRYFDPVSSEKFLPYVIEPSAGLTRSLMAFMIDAYDEDRAPNTKGGEDSRVVLRLDHRLAPFKLAILPLSRHADLTPKAKRLADQLRSRWTLDFDDAQTIGRRYRRQDEIGTPFCVTFDFESLEDQAVTVRNRDDMTQVRIKIAALEQFLNDQLAD